MRRHCVAAVVAMVLVSAGLIFSARRAEAQVPGVGTGSVSDGGILNDPFAFYYAVYLPNQQLNAMRPTPLDSVNDAMVSRQYFAQGTHRSLNDPISPFADTYDPLRPYSDQKERLAHPPRFARATSKSSGMGPSLYFNRVSQYYPDLSGRTGTHKNANVATIRRRGGGMRGGMGGMGMGGMGGGMGRGMGGGMGMF